MGSNTARFMLHPFWHVSSFFRLSAFDVFRYQGPTGPVDPTARVQEKDEKLDVDLALSWHPKAAVNDLENSILTRILSRSRRQFRRVSEIVRAQLEHRRRGGRNKEKNGYWLRYPSITCHSSPSTSLLRIRWLPPFLFGMRF